MMCVKIDSCQHFTYWMVKHKLQVGRCMEAEAELTEGGGGGVLLHVKCTTYPTQQILREPFIYMVSVNEHSLSHRRGTINDKTWNKSGVVGHSDGSGFIFFVLQEGFFYRIKLGTGLVTDGNISAIIPDLFSPAWLQTNS